MMSAMGRSRFRRAWSKGRTIGSWFAIHHRAAGKTTATHAATMTIATMTMRAGAITATTTAIVTGNTMSGWGKQHERDCGTQACSGAAVAASADARGEVAQDGA